MAASLKTIRSRVKKNILTQLELKGCTDEYFVNLVEDYMKLWDQKEQLNEDINSRGVKIQSFDKNGILQLKKNDSCDLLIKTNQQMIKLLEYLGINPNNVIKEDTDEL